MLTAKISSAKFVKIFQPEIFDLSNRENGPESGLSTFLLSNEFFSNQIFLFR